MSYIDTQKAAATLLGIQGPVALTNLAVTPIPATALASGNTNVYTCPAGKRAFILSTIFNNSGGSLNYFPQISYDSGSTYRRTNSLASIGNLAAVQFGGGFMHILDAGEIFAMNVSGTGVQIFGQAYVFDATSKLKKFSKTGSWVSGDNTIYTCPATPSYLGALSINFNTNPAIEITNETGGALNYVINIIPSGGSAATGNRVFAPAATTANLAVATAAVAASMSVGDFISVNTSSTSASQTAWGIVVEGP